MRDGRKEAQKAQKKEAGGRVTKPASPVDRWARRNAMNAELTGLARRVCATLYREGAGTGLAVQRGESPRHTMITRRR